MSNNLINLQIDRYINSRAFCPVDADDSAKEQFLQTIGVEMDGQKVRVNATLTANHIMRYTNMILLSNNELAIYNGKFYEIKSANKIVERIIKAVLNCAGNYWTSRRGKEVVEVLKLIPDFQVKNLDTDNIINFSNGVLSLDDLTLHEHSPKYLCSYMLETEYKPEYDYDYLLSLCKQLHENGARDVVITGVRKSDTQIGVFCLLGGSEVYEYYTEREVKDFHGTGDIYSSAVYGGLMNGKTLKEAVSFACDYTKHCIAVTLAEPNYSIYGVNFEQCTGDITDFIK